LRIFIIIVVVVISIIEVVVGVNVAIVIGCIVLRIDVRRAFSLLSIIIVALARDDGACICISPSPSISTYLLLDMDIRTGAA
jgi:hypothetical protein